MNKVGFRTPVEFMSSKCSLSQRLLQKCEQYLYLGGRKVCVLDMEKKDGAYQGFYTSGKERAWEVAFKIISFATLILPLIALVAILILRPRNPVFVQKPVSNSNQGSQISLAKITQLELCEQMKQLDSFRRQRKWQQVDLSKWLVMRGFSPVIENINFSIKDVTILSPPAERGLSVTRGRFVLKGMLLDGISFKNCQFEGVNFRKSTIKNCRFENCTMDQVVFRGVLFDKTSFYDCFGKDCSFDQAKIQETNFLGCTFPRANFNWGTLTKVAFTDCGLEGASFLESEKQGVSVKDCQMENALLSIEEVTMDTHTTETLKRKLPAIGISWDHDWPLTINYRVAEGIAEHGALPVRLGVEPIGFNVNKLQQEVSRLIEIAKTSPAAPKTDEIDSISYRVICTVQENPQEYPVTYQLIQRAKKVIVSLDALLLPGGWEAVEPEFYGMSREEAQSTATQHPLSFNSDYRMFITEVSLLYWAVQLGKPVIGICRGSQLTNVFFGGKLESEVSGHFQEIQQLKAEESVRDGQIFGVIKEEPFAAFSFHCSANANISPRHLQVISQYQGVPKAIEGVTQLPILLFQFHPEYKAYQPNDLAIEHGNKLSPKNLKLWEAIIKSAQTSMKKQEVIKKSFGE